MVQLQSALMRKASAVWGSVVFFLIAPATVAGLVPFWLSRWQIGALPFGIAQQVAGAILIVAGAAALVHAFSRFALQGRGTPAPVAPTEHLVIGGLYRHVRNPMYLAVLAVVVGQALVLGQQPLVVYALILLGGFVTFVKVYEEPTLKSQFGAQYETYRRAVPGWWPRVRPWRPEEASPADVLRSNQRG